jgi:hypothetical protein
MSHSSFFEDEFFEYLYHKMKKRTHVFDPNSFSLSLYQFSATIGVEAF